MPVRVGGNRWKGIGVSYVDGGSIYMIVVV